MMVQRVSLLTAFLFFFALGLYAQNFTVVGSASIEAVADLNQVSEFYIFFEKQNQDSVKLAWRKSSVEKPI